MYRQRWFHSGLWAGICALPLLTVAGCDVLRARAEIPERSTEDFSGIRTIEIETQNGSVNVACRADRTDVDIAVTRFARGRTEEEALENAEQVDVEIGRRGADSDVLRIAAFVPVEIRHTSAGASFDIALPCRVDVVVRTRNGRVGVEGAQGDVEVRTSNGRVVVRDVTGNARLESSNGAIEIERLDGDRVEARTSNGSITAREIAAQTKLRTSNGSIRLETTSLPERPTVSAITSNGSVHVEIPSTVEAQVRLRTSNGSIRDDLDRAEVSGYQRSKKSVTATLNGGGGSVEAETSNGRITFQTR